jgi:hypothetical protein
MCAEQCQVDDHGKPALKEAASTGMLYLLRS